ncbi:hypothetical protein L2E82_51677 [Cichorium intybus]|nr:hypothetical protein L2E82_51677 [Cichorium intybus]
MSFRTTGCHRHPSPPPKEPTSKRREHDDGEFPKSERMLGIAEIGAVILLGGGEDDDVREEEDERMRGGEK